MESQRSKSSLPYSCASWKYFCASQSGSILCCAFLRVSEKKSETPALPGRAETVLWCSVLLLNGCFYMQRNSERKSATRRSNTPFSSGLSLFFSWNAPFSIFLTLELHQKHYLVLRYLAKLVPRSCIWINLPSSWMVINLLDHSNSMMETPKNPSASKRLGKNPKVEL